MKWSADTTGVHLRNLLVHGGASQRREESEARVLKALLRPFNRCLMTRTEAGRMVI